MIGFEAEGGFKAAPGPGEFFPRHVRVRLANVQLDCVGIEIETFVQDDKRVVVFSFVVELMGFFIEVVGTQETVRHRQGLARSFLKVGSFRSDGKTVRRCSECS